MKCSLREQEGDETPAVRLRICEMTVYVSSSYSWRSRSGSSDVTSNLEEEEW